MLPINPAVALFDDNTSPYIVSLMKYKFFILEGIDRSGKTTVSSILHHRLSPSLLMRFPDRETEIGKLIDRFLKKEVEFSTHTLHLLYSANRYEKSKEIEDCLKTNHVICDRYWLSGAVYSTAKGLDYEWCKKIDEGLPKPDLTFFIDTPVEETSKRGFFGEEAHDKIEFQRKVYETYRQRCPEEGVIVVNGMQSPEKIADEIYSRILQEIN